MSAARAWEISLDELEKCRESVKNESDAEMAALYRDEIETLEAAALENEKVLLSELFPDEHEKRTNIIVEIRAGAGGLEAALFVGDLFRMYSRYAEMRRWKTEPISARESPLGGFKEIIFAIKGPDCYSRLRYESGAHRVQRVPDTESQGRIHTSTSTVAIMPEPDEVEISIDPKDLRIDTFRAGGKGGQHVNKTDSAIRITHIPTGFSVECQDERSQHQNKAKAMRFLRARLLKMAQEQQQSELARDRKNQVGTGDRSERIRTYNFPQGRVSDHRAGVTVYKLPFIIEGAMDDILDPVIEFFRSGGEPLSTSDEDD